MKAIINDVRQNGDNALKQYTEKFDGISLSTLLVSEEEIAEAYQNVNEGRADISLEKQRQISVLFMKNSFTLHGLQQRKTERFLVKK